LAQLDVDGHISCDTQIELQAIKSYIGQLVTQAAH
jgi:hypothetical protein